MRRIGFKGGASAVAIGASIMALAACGSSASKSGSGGGSSSSDGQSSTGGQTFTLGIQEVYSVLPALVAMDQGDLKKHGISNLKLIPFTSLPAETAAMSQGQIDASLQTPTLLQQFNSTTSGSKLAFFAPGQGFNVSWVARKGAGIPTATTSNWQSTVKAWKGKKLGVAALGGLVELVSRYLASQVGLKAGSDFSISAVAAGEPEVAALKAGVVDVTSGDSFGTQAVVAAGAGTDVLDTGLGQGPSIFQGIFESGYLATRAVIEKNHALFTDFAEALKEGREFIANPANKSAVESTIEKHAEVSAAIAAALYPATHLFSSVSISQSAYEKTMSAFTAAALVTKPAPTYKEAVYEIGS